VFLKSELIIDSFAGGGGASLGIEQALGRPVDIAINHDDAALMMHAANHPGTKHVREDVWKANLRSLVGRRKVGLLWASPDCKHFSRAKGSKPVEKAIRSLAWIVVLWAKTVKPRVIVLENVREFADWGPLVPRFECRSCDWRGTEGQASLVRRVRRCPRCDASRLRMTDERYPDPDRAGVTFRRWVGSLRSLGYKCEHKVLNAADYGAPTSRRRLFLIARRDGEPIVWPEPTHGDPKSIDDAPLFDRLDPWRTAAECIDWSLPCQSIFERKRPLQEATMRRIAMGVKRYVLESSEPFIVTTSHTGTTGRGRYEDSTLDPLKTITRCNDKAIITPMICPITHFGERRIPSIEEPLATITTAKRGEIALVAPSLVQIGYGERQGQSPRVLNLGEPLGTVVSGGQKHAMVAAFLAKHFGGVVGVPIDTPLPTITSIATQNQVVVANMIHMNYGDKQWNSPNDPMRTVTSNNHAALVYSFLTKYFGTAIGCSVDSPSPTLTSKDRLGLVLVTIAGEKWVIVDIGMRMLTPRELARAQGFPDSYVLTGTKTSQVARIGNSVCPPMARAIVSCLVNQECKR
jgi:DNA (cytosine-5)-methyltransferase 1